MPSLLLTRCRVEAAQEEDKMMSNGLMCRHAGLINSGPARTWGQLITALISKPWCTCTSPGALVKCTPASVGLERCLMLVLCPLEPQGQLYLMVLWGSGGGCVVSKEELNACDLYLSAPRILPFPGELLAFVLSWPAHSLPHGACVP